MPFLAKHNNREDGFTLVELLIVVLIIGILAAIAIPVYLGLQNQAKNNTAKQDTNSTVHKIQVALTEGQAVDAALTANTDATGTYRSDGTNITSTIAADGKNYTVVGTQKDTQFTYTYDSTTGKFTEGTADVVLGGGNSGPDPYTVLPVINTGILPELTDNTASATTVNIDVAGSTNLTWTGLPTCATANGATLTYQAGCAQSSFSRANPTLTATNNIGTTTRQFYILERRATSTYLYNNDFTTTASDLTNTTGVASAVITTAPDGRPALAVTQSDSTTKLTQTSAGTTGTGGYLVQYGAYFYLPTGVTAQMCIYFNNAQEYCSAASGTGKWVQANNGLTGSNTNTPLAIRFTFSGAVGKTIYISGAHAVRVY